MAEERRGDEKKGKPGVSQLGMSTPDLSAWAHQPVDVPDRRGEKWVAVGLIVVIAFVVGIVIALR